MADETQRNARNDRLPIKLIMPKQGTERRVLGGGTPPAPFRDVDLQYRNRLSNQIGAIQEALLPQLKMTPAVPALQAPPPAPVPTFANRRWFIVVAPDGRETARPLAPEDFITNLPTFPAMLRDPGFHVTDPELFEILRACTDRLTSRMPATIRSAA